MPRKAKAEKEKKRRVVAKAVLAGKGVKVTAREAGCSTRHVERLAAEPATQYLITEALRPHQAKLTRMVERMITAVNVALVATKKDTQDHIARLRAVERGRDLLELAQGKPSADVEQQQGAALVTWEEYLVLYRSRSETRGNTETPDTQTKG
jgi:hypothetical protein